MTVKRLFLAEPGERLLLSSSPFDLMRRAVDFEEATRLDVSREYVSPIIAVPMLLRRDPNVEARYRTTSPAMLWHPMFWLPRAIHSRLLLDGPDGDTLTEPADVWAIRMGLLLTASGLYDPVSGGWLDVLSTIGIDVGEADGRERVRRWQLGATDEAIDGIDLTDMLSTPENPSWSVEAAFALHKPLRKAAYAQAADVGLTELDRIDPDNPDDFGSFARTALAMIFSALPGRRDYWIAAADDTNLAEGLNRMRADLTTLRNAWLPSLDEVNVITAEVGAAVTATDG